MENSAVNICMITDDNYIMPTSVAIHSMITNKGEEQYNFYIITSNLSEESEKKFKDFEQNGVCINIIREDAEKRFNGLHQFRADSICVASLSALLKFIIPDLFPQLDRILYLDGDIIVTSDLEELYNTDLKGNYIAAVIDSGTLYWTNEFISSVKHYFNSGVMLMDLKKMREDHISEVLIETKRNLADSSLMDQNVFNIVFNNKIKLLPIQYNFLPLSLERAKSKWDINSLNKKYGTAYKTESELYLDAKIIHYSSKDKPWNYSEASYAYIWKHYYLSLYNKLPQRKEKYGISVIVPCYNVENYLKQTINTILNQTYKDIEIILIDDGSTDATAKIIQQFTEKHPNITAYYNKNHGQGYERNFGIKKAHGRYIHFMDSDDLIDPNGYETLYNIAFENDLDNILFEAKTFYESKELADKLPQYKSYYRRKTVFPKLYSGKELFVKLKNTVGILASPCLQLIKREFLLKNDIYFPPLRSFEDNLFTFKTIVFAKQIAVLPNAFYSRRIRSNSTMTSVKSKEAVNALAYTVSEIAKIYISLPEQTEYSVTVLKHIFLLCDVMKSHYENACKAGKYPNVDDFGDTAAAIACCLLISNAKHNGNISAHTNEDYRQLYLKLQKTYREKSEINAKLQQTYKEKSELNAKLQKTYKEKSEKTKQIKKLEKWSLYPLLRKVKRFLKKK